MLLRMCFRPGDLARIEEHTTSTSAQKKTAKSKKTTGSDTKARNDGVEGVVYKVILVSSGF